MKRLLPLLFLIIALCGCAPGDPVPETVPQEESPLAAPVSLYDAASSMNQAVLACPLPMSDVCGIAPRGEDYLLFSGLEHTTLTRLSGDGLYIEESTTLDAYLSPENPTLRIHTGGISYYDANARQTVVLDEALQEVKRIAAPEDMLGTPLLSGDGKTLYYCTGNALRAWDLDSGIRRMVKEMAYSHQTVTALHTEDTVLQCRVETEAGQMRTLFLSAENGRLLAEQVGDIQLSVQNGFYFTRFQEGIAQTLLFGQTEAEPAALVPADLDAACFYLTNSQAAVTVSAASDGDRQLDYYELETGLRRSCLTLPSQQIPLNILDGPDETVLVLTYDESSGQELLCLWDIGKMLLNDGTLYTGPHYTAADPDIAGLTQCQAYASQLSETYGIEIKIWGDALEVLPWDYTVEAEYLVPVIQRELDRLNVFLSHFPQGFLEATVSNFTKLRISLVRSLTGTSGVEAAAGVQFFDGTDAHILLTPGDRMERSLYHELYHVMETHILNESIALDQWDKLNPAGFSYDYDYAANAQRDGSAYLQADTRAFIDTYSMSYPKEDRARLLEYAMTEGHESLFQSPFMQAKLSQLCQGIREAYGLKKSEEIFLWEQYLDKPIAP